MNKGVDPRFAIAWRQLDHLRRQSQTCPEGCPCRTVAELLDLILPLLHQQHHDCNEAELRIQDLYNAVNH